MSCRSADLQVSSFLPESFPPIPAPGAQNSSSARSNPCPPVIILDWRCEVNRLWAEDSSNTLAMASFISAGRKQLKRGWSKFWKSSTGLPFKKKKADMLVGVARLIGLSEQTLTHLPHGWSVLYHLGRLEHDLLDRLVHDGEVHPELTGVEAKALVRRRGKPRPTKKKRPAVKARFGELATFVDATLDQWSIVQLEFATSNLRDLLHRLDSKVAATSRTASQSSNSQRRQRRP